MNKSLFQQVFEMNQKYIELEFGKKALELATQKAFNSIAHRLAFDRNDLSEPQAMIERKRKYGRV